MFLKNISDVDIKLNSHEGYAWKLPPGVSAIWDSAGEALLKVYKIESHGVDKFGISNGHGVPALTTATQEEWEKGGKISSSVERFKINHKLIPRAALIKVALKRGVPHDRISEYQIDSTIDPQEIAKDINELEVPEEIRRPVNIEDTPETDN